MKGYDEGVAHSMSNKLMNQVSLGFSLPNRSDELFVIAVHPVPIHQDISQARACLSSSELSASPVMCLSHQMAVSKSSFTRRLLNCSTAFKTVQSATTEAFTMQK